MRITRVSQQIINTCHIVTYVCHFLSAKCYIIDGSDKPFQVLYSSRSHFMHPDGSYLVEGDILYQTSLGDTLEKVATEGWMTFYNGSVALDIVADIEEQGKSSRKS